MVKYGWLELGVQIEKFFAAQSEMVWNYYRDSTKKVENKSPNELVGDLDVVMEKHLTIYLPWH